MKNMTKKIYQVNVQECWIQPTLIEAESAKEALEKAIEGEGRQVADWLEYSCTLDDNTDKWQVYAEKDQKTARDMYDKLENK